MNTSFFIAETGKLLSLAAFFLAGWVATSDAATIETSAADTALAAALGCIIGSTVCGAAFAILRLCEARP